jgi:hypothetical protein
LYTKTKPTVSRIKQFPITGHFDPVLLTAAKARVAQWNKRCQDPEKIQLALLLHVCKYASKTDFGAKHHFGKIESYSDFKDQVPLRNYGDFESYILRMRKGEPNVLWPGLITYFGQSSGSSNTNLKSKFLPISREQISYQKQAAFDLLSCYLTSSQASRFLGGYNLGLLPPSVLKEEVPGIFTGSNPGIMLRFLPLIAKHSFLPKHNLRDIVDYETKIELIAKEYLDYDIRSISGTTCWFSLLFDKVLEIAKKRDKTVHSVQQIWPNLNVLFGGGVQAEPYRNIIEDKIGKPICIIDNYNATEGGVFSATNQLDEDDLLMLLDRGVFFEFVPRSEHGQENANRIPLWEVEKDKDYSLVLTNSSGLYAYYIGDFIKFTSTFPHKMKFIGRATGVISLTQELTSFIEIEESILNTNKIHKCTTVDFLVAPEVGVENTGKGRYVLVVEFSKEPYNISGYLNTFDKELCKINRVYSEHRKNNSAILIPKIICLKKGSSNNIMKNLGFDNFQSKFPRIIDYHKFKTLENLMQEDFIL